MSPEQLKSIDHLKDRAQMLQKARQFFFERNILEVDCGALVKRAPIDANISVISAEVSPKQRGFLHTSPEYSMKRLLARGIGDIFFLGHVFRFGEIGKIHNPEFTMAEWYRTHLSFQELIQETCDFLFLFFGPLPIRYLSYRNAFIQYLNIDYTKDNLSSLAPPHTSGWSQSEIRHYLLSHHVEPFLGQNELTVLTDYPPSEAALACVIEKNGERVAERFEIYYKGIELTNGYHELSNAKELRARFIEENKQRSDRGQEPYLLDEEFLSSLENGFPDCSGVSVGFDRALMLRNNMTSLREVLPFIWDP